LIRLRHESSLLEGADRPLLAYPPSLSSRAKQSLERLGVEVKLNSVVRDVQSNHIVVKGHEGEELIPAKTVLWAAGVKASYLGKFLASDDEKILDRSGRVLVEPDMSLPGHPEVFVIGDLANYPHQTGQPLPGLAPVAMQQGKYVARLIRARLKVRSLCPFHYRDKGNLATIGRAAAVGFFGKLKFSGFLAWLIWLFVHLMYLAEFDNRLLVLIQWAWNYFTWNRGARLITGQAPLPSQETPEADQNP
jgi:NADH dehydrogenase